MSRRPSPRQFASGASGAVPPVPRCAPGAMAVPSAGPLGGGPPTAMSAILPPAEPRRRRAQARVAEGPRPRSPDVPAAQGTDAGAAAPHGLRGGALPQHRGVLAPRHRHVHDPRRRLHARLRLLRRAARAADRRGPGRARARRRRRRRDWTCTTSSSRRSIATTCRTAARRSSPRPIRQIRARVPGCAHRSPHPRFPGRESALRAVLDARAGRPQPQHRDRAAPVPRGALGGPVRADPRPAGSRPAIRAAHPHQVGADGRTGRGVGRTGRRLRATCAPPAWRC